MITVARFKNSADAAFFQSVLQSEGNESTIIDTGAAVTLADDVRVEVADEDVAAARELVARYESESGARAELVERTHPGKGIPFFAIWFITAVVVFVLWDGFIAYTLYASEERLTWTDWASIKTLILVCFCEPFISALGLSAIIYLAWLVYRIIKKPNRALLPDAGAADR